MSTTEPAQDQQKLLEYVERFALVLSNSGFPRMPARVFAYALAEDAAEYTAAELADGLRVSNAAISGAVRYLVGVGMLIKGRKPGSRADHYFINDDELWETIIGQRSGVLSSYQEIAQEGVDQLGIQTRGGQRLWETREFFKFLQEQQEQMIDRWHVHWAELKAEWTAVGSDPPMDKD